MKKRGVKGLFIASGLWGRDDWVCGLYSIFGAGKKNGRREEGGRIVTGGREERVLYWCYLLLANGRKELKHKTLQQ